MQDTANQKVFSVVENLFPVACGAWKRRDWQGALIGKDLSGIFINSQKNSHPP